MKYYIEKIDGLYCIFRKERLGDRIVCAYESEKRALDRIADLKGERP